MSVDLPDPDGPMIAVKEPGCDLERDAAERVDGGVALAVALGQFVSCDDGGGHARETGKPPGPGHGVANPTISLRGSP